MLVKETHKFDVLCFSEHWLSNDEINKTQIDEFYLAGSFCRKSYTGIKAHGGTCIYVRNGIKSLHIQKFENICVENIIELTAVALYDIRVIIICLYRVPGSDFRIFMNNIEILLNDVATKSFKHVVICGDFNTNFLANSKEKEELLNLIDSFNLRKQQSRISHA